MPEEDYSWLPRQEILHFGEMAMLVDLFLDLGVQKIRLTGGEPLLRKELPYLVRMLAERDRIRDLAMTTNGQLLEGSAEKLKEAGLHRLTISLDSLQPERFKKLTRLDSLEKTLRGIDAARSAGFENTRIDSVIMRGVNDDELIDLLQFGRNVGAEVRFIEYMDVGGATRWSEDQVVSRQEILGKFERYCGTIEPITPGSEEEAAAPADRFRFPDGTVFGIISSTTEPFCGSCDRARLTADGTFYMCLYAREGLDLKTPFREGASAEELKQLITETWTGRTDRGAEERLALPDRSPAHDTGDLRDDPRLEMHTRGG